jgi:hypothetical protein
MDDIEIWRAAQLHARIALAISMMLLRPRAK